jgi:protein-S-isoprenylcysteine O-methyltransferase Ste14
MIAWIFIATLSMEVILLILILISIFYPSHRVWPPPRGWSWQFIAVWSLTIAVITGGGLLAILDYNTFIIRHWIRFPIGVILFMGGNALAFWGVKTLGAHASSGLRHRLVTTGPYRFTRNPQYIGDILIFLGVILLSNSFYATIICTFGILLILLMPFAEEPWLREVYGEEYIEYCRRVPRYLGFRRLEKEG